jgi:hypothetical protein
MGNMADQNRILQPGAILIKSIKVSIVVIARQDSYFLLIAGRRPINRRIPPAVRQDASRGAP